MPLTDAERTALKTSIGVEIDKLAVTPGPAPVPGPTPGPTPSPTGVPIKATQKITAAGADYDGGVSKDSSGPVFTIAGHVDGFRARNATLDNAHSLLLSPRGVSLSNAVLENISGTVFDDGIYIAQGHDLVFRNIDLRMLAPKGLYPMGLHLGAPKGDGITEVVKRALVDGCEMRDFQSENPTVKYPNGDSFGSERGCENISWRNLVGYNPTDAAFDLKGTDDELLNCGAEFSEYSLRVHTSADVNGFVSLSPRHADVKIGLNAVARIRNFIATGGAPGRKILVIAEGPSSEVVFWGQDKALVQLQGFAPGKATFNP